MMLGIEINGEFLDLPPGALMELVEENPFLQFSEENVIGNYSFPIEFLLNDKNTRLTGYNGILQKRIETVGIENIRLYGNGIQHSRGRLKIERVQHNINFLSKSRMSAYYLTGSSDFYHDIKGKRLRDIDVGGDRSFAWDNYAKTGPGFWGHITTVARSNNPQDYDYCFFPVLNRAWGQQPADENGTYFSSIMNDIRYDNVDLFFQGPYVTLKAIQTIVPFPWLHYVLKKAVESTGWTIEGEIFNDPDFLKICLINFQAINWGWANTQYTFGTVYHKNPVVFNLQDNLPDISISEFLTALRTRFGWWYNYNFNTKKITVTSLYSAATSSIKDFTPFSSPIIIKTVNQDRKIYALKNSFSTDLADGAPNFDQVSLQGVVDSIEDLPAPADPIYGHAYLVRTDNNFYICALNDAGDTLIWKFYTYNIYDYAPAGATDEITTAATTVGVEKYPTTIFPELSTYLDLLPRVDFMGNWEGRSEASPSWGVILCFYHGKVNNKLGKPYCYGSGHIYDSSLNQVSEWGLSFECKKTDGSDVGLYERQWKSFLNLMSNPEQFEASFTLPFHEALNLKFSDRIIVDNVLMFVKKIKRVLPYQGKLDIEAVRIS
jgi:hypothetical protein